MIGMDSRERILQIREIWMRLVHRCLIAVLAALALAGPAQGARDPQSSASWPSGTAVLSYESERALAAALDRHPARVVRRIPALRVAAVRPTGSVGAFATKIGAEPGIVRVERAAARRSLVEPSLGLDASSLPFQWQYAAIGADRVPPEISAAAAGVTIAIVDTGADVTAPDLGAKAPHAYSIRRRDANVADTNGHGTFVAALAAGSSTNGDGIAGVGGEARLMVVQAGTPDGSFTDVDEAAAIVYAVDHGAKIVNLSLGGRGTSTIERRAVDYAVAKGVLLVAAVGNGYRRGNAVEYPAALLQPVGSNGVGGAGLSVGASGQGGTRADFSSTGSHVSLVAPGDNVFSAVASTSSESLYPRTPLPGSLGGLYGYASGTSFSAPQVAGAAALVWAANPQLRAPDVATVLEQSASGGGSWSPDLGYGVLDVASAVARAQVTEPTAAPFVPPAVPAQLPLSGTRAGARVTLSWRPVRDAATYRVAMTTGGTVRVLATGTTRRTATYRVARGATHRFTVTAFDPAGLQVAVSRPWQVRVPRKG
jgi:subtilisin family serine protease